MSNSHPTGCTSCGTRRITCSGSRPSCTNCQQAHRKCSYDWTVRPHIFELFDRSANLNSRFKLDMNAYQAGEGTFGRVYRTTLKDGRAIAVKVFFEIRRLPGRLLELSIREAWTWSQLDHPQIVPFLGLANYAEVCRGALPQLCLVSPWMTAGNIVDYLKHNERADRLRLAWDIAKGVDYLHMRPGGPIIHGDLKGNNILIDMRKPGPRACIADFGLAHIIDSVKSTAVQTTSTSDAGNCRWLAFERMFPQKYGIEHMPDAKSIYSDVFEMMRTLLQIFTGNVPFHGLGDWEVFDRVRTEQNPEVPNLAPKIGLSLDMWDLMKRAWSAQREARPCAGYLRAFLEEEWCICNALEGPIVELWKLRSVFEVTGLLDLSAPALPVGSSGEVYQRTRLYGLWRQRACSTIICLKIDGPVDARDPDLLRWLTVRAHHNNKAAKTWEQSREGSG